jgi:putative ABC transport system substrate-binding protein
MNRRNLLSLLGGAAAAWPAAARAQQRERVRRVSALILGTAGDSEMRAHVATFQSELERLGWSVGRNIRIDYGYRLGDNPGQFQAVAKEAAALHPDVIFVQGTPLAAALQRETREIPIVFVAVSDPVGLGLVESLNKPGGNITGFLNYEEGIVGKWLAMLKEISPKITRVALIGAPSVLPYFEHGAQPAAAALHIELTPCPNETIANVERIMESFSQSSEGGLAFIPDPLFTVNRDRVIALAERYRLPAVYANRVMVESGGLMSYDRDLLEMFRRGATYVDRILRGEKPADLPVQTPVKYATTINLKTAKTLGLTVPPSLLAISDEVIE